MADAPLPAESAAAASPAPAKHEQVKQPKEPRPPKPAGGGAPADRPPRQSQKQQQKGGDKSQQKGQEKQGAVASAKPAATKSETKIVVGLSHLKAAAEDSPDSAFQVSGIHAAFLQYSSHLASGSNGIVGVVARTAGLLDACTAFVGDFAPPPTRAFSWALDSALLAQLDFAGRVRPHPPPVSNAIRYVRSAIARVGSSMSQAEAKAAIVSAISAYVSERVLVAGLIASAIVAVPPPKTDGGDAAATVAGGLHLWPGATVVTYGRSTAVMAILLAAHEQLTAAAPEDAAPLPGSSWPHRHTVRVIVIDSRPGGEEGLATLQQLSAAGVPVSYAPLSAAAAALSHGDVLLLGAAGVLGDGCVMGRAGTAQLAALAAEARVPVAVAAESFKLCDVTFASSAVWNELRPSADVAHASPVAGAPRKRAAPKPILDALAGPGASSAAPAPAAGGKGAPKPQQQQPGQKGKAPTAPVIVPWVSTGVGADAPLAPVATSATSAPLQVGGPADPLSGWRDVRGLKVLALGYDLTPPSLVRVLLTEAGPLHPVLGVQAVTREFARLEELPQEEGDGGNEEEEAAGSDAESTPAGDIDEVEDAA